MLQTSFYSACGFKYIFINFAFNMLFKAIIHWYTMSSIWFPKMNETMTQVDKMTWSLLQFSHHSLKSKIYIFIGSNIQWFKLVNIHSFTNLKARSKTSTWDHKLKWPDKFGFEFKTPRQVSQQRFKALTFYWNSSHSPKNFAVQKVLKGKKKVWNCFLKLDTFSFKKYCQPNKTKKWHIKIH